MKFRPGDVVNLKRQAIGPRRPNGVIAFETDPLPCVLCLDPECYEWSNVLMDTGKWEWHVPECKMQLSEFGTALREGR